MRGNTSREIHRLEKLRQECFGGYDQRAAWRGEAIGIHIIGINDHLERERRFDLILVVPQGPADGFVALLHLDEKPRLAITYDKKEEGFGVSAVEPERVEVSRLNFLRKAHDSFLVREVLAKRFGNGK